MTSLDRGDGRTNDSVVSCKRRELESKLAGSDAVDSAAEGVVVVIFTSLNFIQSVW